MPIARVAMLVAAFLAGVATVVQSRLNGAVGLAIHDGLVVAWLSFSVSLVGTALIVGTVPSLRRSVRRAWRAALGRKRGAYGEVNLRPAHLLGGIGGAVFVVGQGASVPALGVAVFTVAVVAAQNASSLLADHIGLGPAGRKPVTASRLIAALVATGGVAIAVGGQVNSPAFTALALVLALIAGAAVALQQAVNARVAVVGRSPWAAAMSNFVAGWVAINLSLVAMRLVNGHAWPWSGGWFRPWMLLGGLIGLVFVLIAAVAVSRLGVLLFALVAIAGQVAGALVVGLVAPTPGSSVDAAMVVGVLVTGGAVAIAAYWADDRNQVGREGHGGADQV